MGTVVGNTTRATVHDLPELQKVGFTVYALSLIHILIVLKVVSLLAEFWAQRQNKTSTLNSDKYRIMKQRNWQCDITPAVEELGFSCLLDTSRCV